MKIFNWVHRKLHHSHAEGYISSPKKGEFSYNDSKPQTVSDDTDTNGLLDIWKDGILTIGTLGFDHGQHDNCISKEEVEEEEEEEEEEDNNHVPSEKRGQLNPFVPNVVIPKAEIITCLGSDTVVTKLDVPPTTNVEIAPDTTPLLQVVEKTEMTERKRVTLADLLSAEADMVDISNSMKSSVHVSVKKSATTTEANMANEPPFEKKHKGEHPRPHRKLHRMITRMLKKKIYPDIEGKNHPKDVQKKKNDNNASKHCNLTNEASTIEMISLL